MIGLNKGLGCTDTDTGTSTGMGTIRQHEQFLKNYNMMQQIGHCYDTNTIWVRHPK